MSPVELPATQHMSDDLASVINDMAPVVKETKAGYKTTEFWIAIVGIVLAQLSVLHLPGKYGETITTAALAVGYLLSRGFAKAGVPNVEPSAVAVAPTAAAIEQEVSSS